MPWVALESLRLGGVTTREDSLTTLVLEYSKPLRYLSLRRCTFGFPSLYDEDEWETTIIPQLSRRYSFISRTSLSLRSLNYAHQNIVFRYGTKSQSWRPTGRSSMTSEIRAGAYRCEVIDAFVLGKCLWPMKGDALDKTYNWQRLPEWNSDGKQAAV